MVTDKDVEKLKEVFVTKDELNKQTSEIRIFIQSTTDQLIELITDVAHEVREFRKEFNENRRDTDDILSTHEHRLDRLEDKVYS